MMEGDDDDKRNTLKFCFGYFLCVCVCVCVVVVLYFCCFSCLSIFCFACAIYSEPNATNLVGIQQKNIGFLCFSHTLCLNGCGWFVSMIVNYVKAQRNTFFSFTLFGSTIRLPFSFVCLDDVFFLLILFLLSCSSSSLAHKLFYSHSYMIIIANVMNDCLPFSWAFQFRIGLQIAFKLFLFWLVIERKCAMFDANFVGLLIRLCMFILLLLLFVGGCECCSIHSFGIDALQYH